VKRQLIAAVLAGGILTAPGHAAVAGASSSCLTSAPLAQQVEQVTVDGRRSALAGSIPVLFVHGMNEGPAVWHPSSPSSIPGQAAMIPGMTAWTFNYYRWSLQWVTKPQIGPNLAKAISCLFDVSGNSVIIVTHSMGGLATQDALAKLPILRTPYGATSSPDVLAVINIGTPYQGSLLLSDVQALIRGGEMRGGAHFAAAVEAYLNYCKVRGPTTSGPCSLLSILRSPVGTALEYESAEIRQLPRWPDHLGVWDIVGDMTLSLFPVEVSGPGVGDLVVTTASATAWENPAYAFIETPAPGPAVDGTDNVPCNASITNFWAASCFHDNLPTNKKVVINVVAELRSLKSGHGG
jgi:pimeloyl-ACP methyl ester carboxylesterase